MEYDLVIFDFDGTLADSFPWLTGAINDVADKYGFKRITDKEKQTLRAYGPGELIRHLGVPVWKVPLIVRHVRKMAAANLGQIPLFDGIRDVLQALHDRGIILGIVTSNAENNVRGILGDETASLFRFYECDISIFGKPGRLKRILKSSGIPAGRIIMIGDEIRDMEAARKTGLAAGAVAWGYNNLDALKKSGPDEIFEKTSDITGILTAYKKGGPA